MQVIIKSTLTGHVIDFINGSEIACNMFEENIKDKYSNIEAIKSNDKISFAKMVKRVINN